jgi:Zinc carboxypeptidase
VTPPASVDTISVVRVQGSKAQLAKLDAAGLDVTESRGSGWADVLVAGDAQRRLLAASGLTATTRVADLDAFARRSARADAAYTRRMGAAGSPLPSGRTTYRTYDEVQADLKKLAEQYPDMVRPVTLGTTFQGREIQGVEIADDVKADDGRPTFFLMGEHHAREWPSEEAALEYAFMLVKDRADPRIAALLRNERTTVVPVVNVDGFVSTVEASAYDPNDNLGGDPNVELAEAVAPPGGILAYRRKNCDGEIPSGDAPCALQWGIDNNRNYGNLWGGEGGSPDPTSQSYKGPAPRSEPETQAVWDYSRTHQVTALMTLHTIAALVLRPPGLHDAGKAPDEQRMKELGDAMGKATAYTSQYSFQLYDTAGTTEDDTYAGEGGYGYTIEMGPSGGLFHMPYETGVVTQWERGDNPPGSTAGGLREALLLIAEAGANPADHAVISGTTRPGAVLRLKKSFDTKTSPYCDLAPDPAVSVMTLPCAGAMHDPVTLKDTIDTTTTVPASGQFEWHVNQSTRPFVGGGALIQKLSDTPSREDTFTGGGPSPDNQPTSGHEDREFTITPEDHADAVKIDVSWGTPEDYDVEVYRKNADGSLTKVGSSGNQPGTPEEVVLTGDQAAPGTYVLRVVNFAAVVGTWTAKVGRYTMTTTTTTGHPEAYTLTCEVGGQAIATRQLFIARGQRLDVDPCGTEAPATLVGSASGRGAAGGGACGGCGEGGGEEAGGGEENLRGSQKEGGEEGKDQGCRWQGVGEEGEGPDLRGEEGGGEEADVRECQEAREAPQAREAPHAQAPHQARLIPTESARQGGWAA